MAEWTQKQKLYTCCLQATHFRSKCTHRLKVRGWKTVFHANGNQKKVRITIPMADKINYETKTRTEDKDGHYIMIKGSIQKDITIVNIYAHNKGAPKYIKQILRDIKGKIYSNTITVGEFNTSLTS